MIGCGPQARSRRDRSADTARYHVGQVRKKGARPVPPAPVKTRATGPGGSLV
jgi:hypothetical protein